MLSITYDKMNKTGTENRIKAKLRSKSGASITFALLLFLVCASLSAVILVAATTASGRMASIAGTDQRYYSVTSAAELLRDELSGGAVSTFTVTKGGNSKKLYFNCPMNEITYASIADAIGAGESDSIADTVAGADPDVPEPVGPLPVEGGFADRLAAMMLSDNNNISYVLAVKDSSGAPIDSLGVDITGTKVGNDLELNVSSGGYKILLRFKYDRRDVDPPVSISDDYTISDSHEITWDLIEMANAYDYHMLNKD